MDGTLNFFPDTADSRPLNKSSGRPQLHAWILSDKKPGHFNQSKGIVRSLEFSHEVSTDWIDLRMRFNGHRRTLSWLLNHSTSPFHQSTLRWFYDLQPLPEHTPDLIISAGGNTLYANAWLARSLNVPNLFCGDIRRLQPRHFAKIITWLDERTGEPFLRWPMTPVPILPEDAAQEGVRFRSRNCPGDEQLWTLLVGGNGGGYTYHDSDWRGLAAFLKETSNRHGIRWLVVSSRRTGERAEGILKDLFDPSFIAHRSFYSKDRSTSYLGCLGAAERVFCTEDSHMMVTEAISTGRPTYSLIPESAETHWTNQKYLDAYVANGHLSRLPINCAANVLGATPVPLPMTDGPLSSLGHQLSQWWQERAA